MRPELFRLEVDAATSLALYLCFLAVTFVVALRGRAKGTPLNGAVAKKAFVSSLLASLTCGLLGSRDPKDPVESGPDLFVPGTLATLGGLAPFAVVLLHGKFELPVQSYPVAMALGFVVVIWLCAIRLRARGFDQAHILDVAIICILAGPIGSRAFFVAQYWDDYFADRPALVESGALVPLEKGDELEARTREGTRSVAFAGDETTWEAVKARTGALSAAGVRTSLVTLDRRGPHGEVIHLVRGVELATLARGSGASLVVSGAAARKLGLATTAEGNHGLDVPWVETLRIWNGGIVFYGGLIAATLCSILYLRFRRYPILGFADAIGPVMGIGLAFGRVGCLLNGCCWGTETSPGFATAVRFPVGSYPWLQHLRCVLTPAYDRILESPFDRRTGSVVSVLAAAVPADLAGGSHFVHPVQVYDAVGDLALAALVFAFSRFVAKREGQTFFLFYIGYSISRFVAEHFRGDQDQFWVLGGYSLTISQIVSLVTLPVALGLFVWATRRTLERAAGDVGASSDVLAGKGS